MPPDLAHAALPLPGRKPVPEWLLLSLLALNTFVITTAGTSLSPFLHEMAQDFDVSLGMVGSLLAWQAVAWGVGSLVLGRLSDRLGRRVPLLVAVLLFGVTRLGLSTADSFGSAVFWQTASGACGGAFMGVVFAAGSDHTPIERRGRALGWILTGQSLSLLLGTPTAALLGSFGGWELAARVHGALAFVVFALTWLLLPADPRRAIAASTDAPAAPLRLRPLVPYLSASLMERVGFGLIGIYFAAFLQLRYGVSFATLALCLAWVATGTLIGNTVGAWIADRRGARVMPVRIGMGTAALLALPLMLWTPALWVTLGFAFAYTFSKSLTRPAIMKTLSDVPAAQRGAVLGLNITIASVGWLAASVVGGWAFTAIGPIALGVIAFTVACVGFGVTWRMPRPAAVPASR
ncbi:MAG: MFS transporter [Burkholderiales bacterium]|nr:MFS transporter [Burkholderiales bacterium]